jgi:hypothetical protein
VLNGVLRLQNKSKAEVHPEYLPTGPKEEEDESDSQHTEEETEEKSAPPPMMSFLPWKL